MSQNKKFVATNLSFFAAPKKCRDINFFVVTNIFTFISFALSRHSLLCCNILSGVLLYLCSNNIFFCRDKVSHSCMLLLS